MNLLNGYECMFTARILSAKSMPQKLHIAAIAYFSKKATATSENK